MLKVLPKYCLREHVGPFILALSVINSLFILNLLVRELGKFLSKGIGIETVFEFLFLNLAWMVALSVPMAVLCATIMAFGRLSAENEITAVKAGGVSLAQVLPSLFLVGALLAAGLVWFNNHVLPDFNHRARMLAIDIARKKPAINLDSGVLYTDIPNYGILVQQVEDRDSVSVLRDIIIDDQTDTHFIKTIFAKSGEMRMQKETGLLRITLFDGEVHEVDMDKPESFKHLLFRKQIINLSMAETILSRSESGYRGDREKSAAQLMETVKVNQKRVAERQRNLAGMLKKQFEKYARPRHAHPWTTKIMLQDHRQLKRRVESEVSMIESYKRSADRYLVEYYKKYSIPAACLVFLMVGAPLGVFIHRSGWAVATALSFGFFIVYWAFLIGGETLADRRIVSPFMAMWSPNFVVGGAGILLLLRATTVTGFPRLPRFRKK